MCNSLLVLWKLSVSQEPLNAIKGETLPSAVTVASVSVLCGIPSITIIAVNLEVNFSSFLMMHILLIPNLKLSRLCGGGIVFRNMQRYWKWMTHFQQFTTGEADLHVKETIVVQCHGNSSKSVSYQICNITG